MAHGWRRRSTALVPSLAVAAAMTGCRWLPVRHPTPPAGVAATALEPIHDVPLPTATLTLTPPLPELRPISDSEALSPAPTPILDAAARRDEAIQRAMSIQEVEPAPAPKPPDDIPPSPEPQTPPGDVTSTSQTSSKPRDAEPPISDVPPDAQATWVQGIETLKNLAREKSAAEGESGSVWMARKQILEGLADPNDPSLWKTVLNTLGTEPDPVRVEPITPPPLVEPVRIEPVAPVGPEITDLRLCRKVIGFGKIEPLPLESLRPGRDVLVYCEVDRQGVEEVDGEFRSRLQSTLAILKDERTEPVWIQTFGVEDRCGRHRRDFFVGYNVTLPETLPPGDYLLRLSLEDQVTNRETVRILPVTIRR